MAFGQQSGPPASAREVAELEALLGEAGYSSFKEARHVYGLTQRQAGGRFTRTEAAELLERLTDEVPGREVSEAATATVATGRASSERSERRRAQRDAEAVAALPDELLADELARRGWMCVPPS